MKVLLRDCNSQLFLDAEDQWTSDQERARDFGHSFHAIKYVFRRRLDHMEVLLAFSDPVLDLALPVFRSSPMVPGEPGWELQI